MSWTIGMGRAVGQLGNRVVEWDDPFWQEDLQKGSKFAFPLTVKGVPCFVTIEADDIGGGEIGWARVVGLAVGPLAVAAATNDDNEMTTEVLTARGVFRTDPLPDALQVFPEVKTAAVDHMHMWETTRRFYRAMMGNGYLPAVTEEDGSTWVAKLPFDERAKVIAAMQNLAIQAGFPGRFVWEWAGIGKSHYHELLNAAKAAGIQVETGSRGRPKKGQK